MDLNALHELGWINKHRPFWWNIDYSPDPREVVSLEDFLDRIETVVVPFSYEQDGVIHDLEIPKLIYLGDKVPIVEHPVEVENQLVDLFITARPYNENEIERLCNIEDDNAFIQVVHAIMTGTPLASELLWPIENLREYSQTIRKWVLSDHFLPHIRGVIRETRNNTLFWNPICSVSGAIAINETVQDILPGMFVWLSLEDIPIDCDNPNVHTYDWYGKIGAESISKQSPVHQTPYSELKSKSLIAGKRFYRLPTSNLEEVAYDEFFARIGQDRPLISVYPLRLPYIDETITLVLSTGSDLAENKKKPTVLGVLGRYSVRDEYRVWRFKDLGFCKDIATKLKSQLDLEFDVLHFLEGRYHPVSN